MRKIVFLLLVLGSPMSAFALCEVSRVAVTQCGATALASNPTDCSANQFANAIDAEGDLTCGAIADADVPNTITINLAATATALAANPSDCSANTFATTIAASGNLTCATPVLGTDTDGNYAGSASEGGAATTASALAANGANCSAGAFPLGVDVSGAAESCTAQNAGTDITADLEEDAHCSEHDSADVDCSGETVVFAADSVDAANVNFNYAGSASEGGAATTASALAANGANCSAGAFPLGVDASGAAESCTAQNAGTDITADLEEDAHCSEHDSADVDCSGETIVLATDAVDVANVNFNYAGSGSEGGAATTATALAANGANCSIGNYPLGVDASGAVENCTEIGVLGLATRTTTATVNTTADETDLTSVASLTVPTAGETYNFDTRGTLKAAGVDTLNYRVSIGGTTVCSTGELNPVGTALVGYELDALVTVRVAGASATVQCNALFRLDDAAGLNFGTKYISTNTTAIDLDGTPSITLKTTIDFSASSADNEVNEESAIVVRIK